MEDNEFVVYEAKGTVDGYDESMYAVFETQEMAELWLSDFYDGAYHRMVIEDRPETDYEEIARFLEIMDENERSDDS